MTDPGWTSHGHRIPGVTQAGEPGIAARCGGPAVCATCARDAAKALGPICPRCGSGTRTCTDGYPHDLTCALYTYTRDVCADCAAAMAREAGP